MSMNFEVTANNCDFLLFFISVYFCFVFFFARFEKTSSLTCVELDCCCCCATHLRSTSLLLEIVDDGMNAHNIRASMQQQLQPYNNNN